MVKLDVYVDLETVGSSGFSTMYSVFYKRIINTTAKLDVYVDIEITSLSGFNSMYSATYDTNRS